NAGPDAAEDVVGAAPLEDDGIDAGPLQQPAEHEAGGSRPDDRNLRAHVVLPAAFAAARHWRQVCGGRVRLPMDGADKELDDTNMTDIPVYALYGENTYSEEQNWLHWETITSRSRLYGFHIAPHRHEQFFQVLFLARGEARVTLDGLETVLAAPALVTVPALTVHGYAFSPDVEGFVLTLFERDLAGLLAEVPEILAGFSQPCIFGPQTEGLSRLAADIARLAQEADRA